MKRNFFKSFFISIICFGLIFFSVDKFFINKVEKTADGQVVETKVKGELMVLLMGIDNDGPDANASITQEKGRRTDTMMLAKANFDTGQIEILSIPRDTRVMVNGKEDKINHAHSYGGPELAMRTVEDFLGIDLDYYVKVDFNGVRQIVDAIGGVEIDVPRKMYYNDPTAKPPLLINIQPGLQTLDGNKAHDYLRFRSYPDGDIGRVAAQQYFMKELAKQVLSPKNILNVDKLIKTYYDYVDTNISMSTMLKYGLSANKLDVDNMRTEMVPGTPKTIGGVSYWVYDMVGTATLVEEMFGEYSIYK